MILIMKEAGDYDILLICNLSHFIFILGQENYDFVLCRFIVQNYN